MKTYTAVRSLRLKVLRMVLCEVNKYIGEAWWVKYKRSYRMLIPTVLGSRLGEDTTDTALTILMFNQLRVI